MVRNRTDQRDRRGRLREEIHWKKEESGLRDEEIVRLGVSSSVAHLYMLIDLDGILRES